MTTKTHRVAHLSIATAVVTATLLACVSAQAVVSEWVDIHVDNGNLWLDTKVGGVPGYSMIDSGAQLNGINNNFLTASGQTYPRGRAITIVGVVGREKRRTYESIPVELFGNEINFKGLVDLNFGDADQQLIIGAPLLKLYVFQFDYPNKRMRIITRDSIDLKKQKNVKSKLDLKTGDPIVQVRLNDEKNLWVLLDTGNNGGVLMQRSTAKKGGWLKKYPTKTTEIQGAITSGQIEQFNLPTFKIGDFELNNVIVSVPADGRGFGLFEEEARTGSRIKTSRSQYQGILGYDVLKHFIVTIDYKSGHVHLEVPSPVEPAGTID